MPYIPMNLDDEEIVGNPLNISGASTTADPATQNVGTPRPVKGSGSWTNLNAYLDANKDNAVQMGNTVAANISGQGTKTQGLIDSAKNDFTTKSDAGTIKDLNKAQEDATNIVGAARKNAYGAQINDDQVNRFKDVSNAEYKGPNDLSASDYYTDTQANVDKSNQYKSNAQSDEGRFGLLQEMFARPTYSQGQKNLDNLLIQGNSTAKGNIQNAANSLNNLQGNWDAAITNAADLAKQRTADSAAAREYARSNLTSNRDARTGEVDGELKNIQDNWTKEYDTYANLLDGYQGGDFEVTQGQADKLALKGAGQGIYNLLKDKSAADYLDLQNYDANKVVSKDQVAQLTALDRLANQFGGNSISKYTNMDQAGTLGLDNNFQANRFGQAADVADVDFNRLAADTDINASGAGERAYYTGLFGQNRHVAKANATMDANLGDYLNNGNYNFNGEGFNNGPKAGSTNTSSGATNLFNYANNAVDSLGSLVGIGGDDGSSDLALATRDANSQAQSSFMNQLNEILGNEGYNNRVKIK